MTTTHEIPTTDTHLETVIKRESCKIHKAKHGIPCWILESSAGTFLQGICNKRARRAGFTHPISAMSLSRSAKK